MTTPRRGSPSGLPLEERGGPGATTGARAILLAAALAALLGALLGLVAAPPSRLGDPRTGDTELVADAAGIVGPGRGFASLSVARIEDGHIAYAGLGAAPGGSAPTPRTPYELGSITKTWTGMLVADAVRGGQMRLDTPVRTYLRELAGSPAGEATVRQLATHTSGLPSLPPDALLGAFVDHILGRDAYADWDTARVLAAARTIEVDTRDAYAYSNLGMAVLGHASARAAGVSSWQDLVAERLLHPLGMDETTFVTTGGEQPSAPVSAHRSNGWPTAAWTGEGFAPAGSATRTTAGDLARFAQAVLAGRAPGMDALTPLVNVGDTHQVGLAWHTSTSPAGTMTWHNGGVGGGYTMLALDRVAGRAALVLTNSAQPVDEVAAGLLHPSRAEPSSPPFPLVGILILVVATVALVGLFRRVRRPRDRAGLTSAILDGSTVVALALALGPWHVAPFWVFGALAGAILAGVALAARALAHVPPWPQRRRPLAILGLAVSALLLLVAVVIAAGPLV